MNILFFSTYYSPYLSGITTYPQKLLQHLSQKHQIQVLTFKHDSSLATDKVRNGISIHRMPYLLRLSKGFISPQSVFAFIKYIRHTDLVVLNLPNVEGLLLAVVARLFNKPILSIFHCRIDMGPSLIERFISFCANTSIYLQLKLSHQIVAYTQDYFQSLEWYSQLKSKTSYILPPVEKLPVDQNYLAKLSKAKSNRIWIGFAGRIAKEKGLTYLIDALHRLKNDQGLELIFTGPRGKQVVGESDYYRQIIHQLKAKHIKHRFLGTLKDGQLGAFYQAIDVLVLPSINQTEAFGMVQTEAMLLDTPVIASDLPGVRVAIGLTHMGIIAPPKDTDQLSQAIDQIIHNHSDYTNSQLTTQATKIFDINKTYAFYDQLIDSLQ